MQVFINTAKCNFSPISLLFCKQGRLSSIEKIELPKPTRAFRCPAMQTRMCNRIMDEDVPLSSFEKHLKNAKLHLIEGESVQYIDLEEVEVQALEELKEGRLS